MSKTLQYRFKGSYGKFASQVLFTPDRETVELDGCQIRCNERGILRFGVGRAGHGAGYWYEPTAHFGDGELTFSGEILCKKYDGTPVESTPWTWKDWALYIPICILISPIALALWIYRLFRPEETEEQRLDKLMTGRLHCEKLGGEGHG